MYSIRKKIVLIILADNDHGKGHIIRSLVSDSSPNSIKNCFELNCGNEQCGDMKFNGYKFIRSYQEYEKPCYENRIEECLKENIEKYCMKNQNLNHWYDEDIIIIPSHVTPRQGIDYMVKDDIDEIARVLNIYGYNLIAGYIIKDGDEFDNLNNILIESYWSEKIEIRNPKTVEWEQQTKDLGEELRKVICKKLCIY